MVNQLPLRYADAVILKDNTEGWRNELLYDTCAAFLDGYRGYAKQGKAPMFCGVSGSGKTYAMAAVTNKLAEACGEDFTYVWAPVSEIFNTLTNHRDYKTDYFWTLDQALKRSDWVVFDDFGFLSDYPRFQDLFWMYVNHRYDNQLQTAFTAQFDLPNGWESLAGIIGEAFARRLEEMCGGLMVVTGL